MRKGINRRSRRKGLPMKESIRLALVAAATAAVMVSPSAASAQRTDGDAFTWSGNIPQGRWIVVHNLNGTVEVTPSTSGKVEVTATKHVRRGDAEYVRFEVRKFGTSGQDVSICALWGENSTCDEDGYHGQNNDRRWGRENEVVVEFQVRVPKGVKVGAHSVNGEVRVDDVASEVEAESVNGSVTVSTLSGPVNANTVNGSVRASMGKFDLNSDL